MRKRRPRSPDLDEIPTWVKAIAALVAGFYVLSFGSEAFGRSAGTEVGKAVGDELHQLRRTIVDGARAVGSTVAQIPGRAVGYAGRLGYIIAYVPLEVAEMIVDAPLVVAKEVWAKYASTRRLRPAANDARERQATRKERSH